MIKLLAQATGVGPGSGFGRGIPHHEIAGEVGFNVTTG
jgi:hypothetical protein